MRTFLVLVVELFVLFSSVALAQNGTNSTNGLDPVKNMCYRWFHQSTVKNNTLYIDGGLETFVISNYLDQIVEGTPTWGYNLDLITVDLSTSWNSRNGIPVNTIKKTASPSTGSAPPNLSRGALYSGLGTATSNSTSSQDKIWLYGGTVPPVNTSFPGYMAPPSVQLTLWSYDTLSREWENYDVGSASQGQLQRRPSGGAWAEAPDLGLSFYLGGKVDGGSEYDSLWLGSNSEVLPGMVVIETSNELSQARNVSTDAVATGRGRIGGSLQYLPGVGSQGVLALIGGGEAPTGVVGNVTYGDLVSLETIDIFDVASLDSQSQNGSGWYKQKTTGKAPAPRTDFCVVAATAPDKSSYNIFLYGGRNASTIAFDDVYVLSLPQFRWTQVYFNGQAPRYGHTCHPVGDRQMISVGGQQWQDMTAGCDFESSGVAIYDLPTGEWGSVYNASAFGYGVPEGVWRDIGGSAQGNATMKEPDGGFSSPELKDLFYPPAPPAQPLSASSTISVGAIVGLVLGLIVFLAIITISFYELRRFWLSHRKKHVLPAEVEGIQIEEKDGYPTSPWVLSPDSPSSSPDGILFKPVEMMSPTGRAVELPVEDVDPHRQDIDRSGKTVDRQTTESGQDVKDNSRTEKEQQDLPIDHSNETT